MRDRLARRLPVRPSDRHTAADRWRARHVLLGSDGARRYLAPGLTLPELFGRFAELGIDYAVLRWFTGLPDVAPGEDVDLLVADEHLASVHELLRARPARRDSQAFDVYSVSGLPGSDFLGVPYYPPWYARELLSGVELVAGLYRVPNPKDHLTALAYHVAYHKGYRSGLPPAAGADAAADARQRAEHDYAAVLGDLADRLGVTLEPTLDGLDRFLAEAGLRPPRDTLERLWPRNPWIGDRFFTGLPPVEDVWAGLAVFVVRERAEDRLDVVATELGRHGFEVLEVVRLDGGRRAAATHEIRGGNWTRGPWALSGGGPAAFVIAYDVNPRPDPAHREPLSDLRIAEAKREVRATLLAGLPESMRYNPVHSADHPRQALEYLAVLADPGLMTRLRAAATGLVESCRFPFPVVRTLAPDAPARRARVAVVEHPVHGRCVCKVYRPGARRFFERELRARVELAGLPLVPELLDHGDTWLLTPLYADDGRHVERRLPFATGCRPGVQLTAEAARALAGFARELHERGLFVLDLTTENLVSDPRAGLKVIDLEFLQEYAGAVPPLERSYTFRGVPDGARADHDVPLGVPLTGGAGNPVFHPALAGLPVTALLRPAAPQDDPRRRAVQLGWYAGIALTRATRDGAVLAARSRWGRPARKALRLVRGSGSGRR